MPCCCPHSQSANKFFSFFAKSYRRRFTKKGFEASQQQLLTAITQSNYKNKTLLEIGCGVGHLHQTLLEQGALYAVGIELATEMITEATSWAKQRGLDNKTKYLEGDFIEIGDSVKSADIVILDKVVCCYPDANSLIHRSLEKCHGSIALTYPRKVWYTRLGTEILALLMKLLGSSFRPYVHDPVQIEKWIIGQGFKKTSQNHTFIWLTQIYQK